MLTKDKLAVATQECACRECHLVGLLGTVLKNYFILLSFKLSKHAELIFDVIFSLILYYNLNYYVCS